MLAIEKVEELHNHLLNDVSEILFENRHYRHINIIGESGDLYYCESERQIIKVYAGLIKVEYRILTAIDYDNYRVGY